MLEQVPNIADDLQFQKDATDYARDKMKRFVLHGDTISVDLEQALYTAWLRGAQAGFSCGWRLKEIRMNEEAEKQRIREQLLMEGE